MKELNIIICGVGGQGNLLLVRIIGTSAMREGHQVRAADTFGVSQRGGSVLSHIRIGSGIHSSMVPLGRCDLLLGLEPGEALRRAADFVRTDGLIIVNTAPVLPSKVKVGEETYPPVKSIMGLLRRVTPNVIELDAAARARETTGSERSLNMVMAGVMMAQDILPIRVNTFKEEIQEKTGGFSQKNLQAFEVGFQIGELWKKSKAEPREPIVAGIQS
jgi:indolepyruvate ferredoxin oxidoreductase beta subunit